MIMWAVECSGLTFGILYRHIKSKIKKKLQNKIVVSESSKLIVVCICVGSSVRVRLQVTSGDQQDVIIDIEAIVSCYTAGDNSASDELHTRHDEFALI